MTLNLFWSFSAFIIFVVLPMIFAARAILRPHREPVSRLAWVLTIFGAPLLGMIAYIFLGETNIGSQRSERENRILKKLPVVNDTPGMDVPELLPQIPSDHKALFRVGESVNHFKPIGGNQAQLMANSNAAIDNIVADIDAASDHVHVCFYIWLADTNGLKVAEALKRAAGRGIKCRAMADALGSRALIKSNHWQDMIDAGVHAKAALQIGNPILRTFNGRIDLRNHRKNIIIDNEITYSGSLNCADPEFLVKAKFAPWVDILIRWQGPIARQNQKLFAIDWMLAANDDLSPYLRAPVTQTSKGITCQAIGTGPTVRPSAMTEVFTSLMFAAQRHLFITTPYFVPDEPIMAALCAAAIRGVDTTIIFPARNDSKVVGAASRSYYEALLLAGVKIFEYHGGLLHAKTLTMDDDIALIGSANMDRRSFELNYENNILSISSELTALIRERQKFYLSSSTPVSEEVVTNWSIGRRLWNNTIAMMGPVL